MAQAPRSDPNMLSTESSADELSPTAMILRYLAAHGQQPTAANISRVLQANALNPGQAGPYVVSEDLGPNSQYGSNQLRNTGVEDSAPAAAPRRAGPPVDRSRGEAKLTPQPGDTSAQPNPSRPPLPPVPSPDPPGPTLDLPRIPLPQLPPEGGAPVTPGGQPQMPPPTPGAAVARPMPPTDPMGNAITQALEPPRPPGQLALPAPEAPVRPAIAAPPEVPMIEAAPRPLALAAPEAPRALPPPEVPLGNFSEPQGEPGGRVRVGNVTPKAAPGKPVQGYPIEQTPTSRATGRITAGTLAGAGRGGLGGAILGGLSAATPEVKAAAEYVMKNLHLR